MTMFNGAKHDVEDILASIRTSIADRSPGYEMDRRDAHVTALDSAASLQKKRWSLSCRQYSKHRHNPLQSGLIFSVASAKFCRRTVSMIGIARGR